MKAWERYRDLLQKCLHHGLPTWLQVQTFYIGLEAQLRTMIDAAAGRALMSKTHDEAYALLEEIASNNYQWSSKKAIPKRTAGIHDIDATTILTAQIGLLTKQLEESQITPSLICELCGGPHSSVEFRVGNPFATTQDTPNKIEENKDEEDNNENPELEMKQPKSVKTPTPYVPPVPFPQHLRKNMVDKEFKNLDVFKKLHINIPFTDAVAQMPNYARFLKDILSKKRKLEEYETVKLAEECSATLQKKLPPKIKDPGSFTTPCTIGNLYFEKALRDLGTTINLMSLSIFRKLGLGEVKATSVTLQLADRSIKNPREIIEHVLVKVDKFIFPDFLLLDMEEDSEIPLILGQPFLTKGRILIDVQEDKLILRVQDEKVVFNVFEPMGYSSEG
ncbi:LOW QUALITY PROTEIN: hypothetical protein CFOL_v3_26994 [Cephalotus follicularis]|uniref:Gag-asp_proteas domain-containing protein n=1 Tax=Cephalotus follicularis TaxID=3775 RepID=A0A1Q3CU20_CEPFO|nr:LOW QUALITY PROTEIN: hypothetical protein CFOL_v3_26994 [Cephalotus follicularis]